jgi:hypothetical protein
MLRTPATAGSPQPLQMQEEQQEEQEEKDLCFWIALVAAKRAR